MPRLRAAWPAGCRLRRKGWSHRQECLCYGSAFSDAAFACWFLDPFNNREKTRAMTYGFIGSGKMATALVQGAVDSGAIAREADRGHGYRPGARGDARRRGGRARAGEQCELARASAVLVLCVKPGDALAALEPLRAALAGKTLISIVAGLPIAALQEAAGARMPARAGDAEYAGADPPGRQRVCARRRRRRGGGRRQRRSFSAGWAKSSA